MEQATRGLSEARWTPHNKERESEYLKHLRVGLQEACRHVGCLLVWTIAPACYLRGNHHLDMSTDKDQLLAVASNHANLPTIRDWQDEPSKVAVVTLGRVRYKSSPTYSVTLDYPLLTLGKLRLLEAVENDPYSVSTCLHSKVGACLRKCRQDNNYDKLKRHWP
jgi:hypothetical protein